MDFYKWLQEVRGYSYLDANFLVYKLLLKGFDIPIFSNLL